MPPSPSPLYPQIAPKREVLIAVANKNTLWGGMLETFTNGFKKVSSGGVSAPDLTNRGAAGVSTPDLQTGGEWESNKSGVLVYKLAGGRTNRGRLKFPKSFRIGSLAPVSLNRPPPCTP